MKKESGVSFNVECHECGKQFDFSEHLIEEDNDKHIAEIILEKCGGDLILCKKCSALKRKTLDKGAFEWVAKGPGKFRLADLELTSEDGAKSIWKVKNIDEKEITFEIKRSTLNLDN